MPHLGASGRTEPRRSARFPALALALGVLAAPQAARADSPPRAVVFPFEELDLPDGFDKEPDRVSAVIELRFRSAGFAMAAPTMLLRDMMVAVGCTKLNSKCARALAAHFEVQVLVVGKVVLEEGVVRAIVRRYSSDGVLAIEVTETVPEAAGERPSVYSGLADTVVVGRSVDSPVPPPEVERRVLRATTLAAGGIGLAFLVASVPTGIVTYAARRDLRDFDDLTARTEADFEDAERFVRRGKLAARLTQVFIVGAALGVVTAAVLAVLDLRASKAASVSVVPLPGRGALVGVEVKW